MGSSPGIWVPPPGGDAGPLGGEARADGPSANPFGLDGATVADTVADFARSGLRLGRAATAGVRPLPDSRVDAVGQTDNSRAKKARYRWSAMRRSSVDTSSPRPH